MTGQETQDGTTADGAAGASAEDRLIEKYFRPIATHPGAFDLSDDAAAITPPPGCDLVLKTDGVIGGVHFFPEDPPDAVARKALRINLSDLAAKGAAPLGFLLAIGLPAGLPPDWLAAFAQGCGGMPSTMAVRCWAAIRIVAQAPLRFIFRRSALCRTAPWCGGRARSPATSWS